MHPSAALVCKHSGALARQSAWCVRACELTARGSQVLRAKAAGYLNHCHVVVGTPEALAEVGEAPNAFPVMAHTKARVRGGHG